MPALVLLLAACGVLILFFFNPSQFGFYPTCLFYTTTGLLCPGCGGLRALHHLLHGHLLLALHCNALLVLGSPVFGGLAVRFILRRRKDPSAFLTVRPAWLWCGLVVLVVFGIARNLPFAHAAWLAP